MTIEKAVAGLRDDVVSSTLFLVLRRVVPFCLGVALMLAATQLLVQESSVTFGSGILGPLLGGLLGLGLRRIGAVLTFATLGGLADVAYGVLDKGASTPREALVAIMVVSIGIGSVGWLVPPHRRGPWVDLALCSIAVMASSLVLGAIAILLEPGSSDILSPDPNVALVEDGGTRTLLYGTGALVVLGIVVPALWRLFTLWQTYRDFRAYAVDLYMFSGAFLVGYGVIQWAMFPRDGASGGTALAALALGAVIGVVWDARAIASGRRYRPMGVIVLFAVAFAGAGLVALRSDGAWQTDQLPAALLCLVVVAGLGLSARANRVYRPF